MGQSEVKFPLDRGFGDLVAEDFFWLLPHCDQYWPNDRAWDLSVGESACAVIKFEITDTFVKIKGSNI